MGDYVVNGELVQVSESNPTAADLKRANNSVESDWVMATRPGGQIEKVDDHSPLPKDATDFAVVTPYEYGGAGVIGLW